MADTEIINVLLKLENPQVFDQLQKLKSEQFQIKFSGSLDKGIQDILALRDKKISITADVQGAINSLKGVETSLQSISKLQNIKLNLTGDVLTDLGKIQKKMLELQAINLTPQLNQLGFVQNNNPNTLTGGSNAINQAEGLKAIQDEFNRALNTLRAQSVNRSRQLSNETIQGTRDEITSVFNPGQQQSPRVTTYGDQTQLTARQSAARRQEAAFQAEDRAAQAAKDFERAQELAKAQVREEALSRLRANAQGDFNKFFREVQPGVANVNSKFNARANALAAEKSDFFQSIQPDVRGLNSKFDSTEQSRQAAITAYRRATQNGAFSLVNQPELDKKRQQETLALSLAGRQAAKKELGGLFTELGLGFIGGKGLIGSAGSLLGGLAGAAAGPGGALLGSQIGGVLGDQAAKGLEAVASALENVTQAGIEFQKTIVALTGVFQANTDVVGADGKALSAADQVKFNSQQAKTIQKSARAGLLPLGIGGEAEATLVQGLVSGFSQRGIILSADQTKTVSSRLGAAIVALAPQILQNPNQERKDVEDIAANSPNAKRTTLGVALKSIAPDLFRPLASGDEIVKATARLEQFVQAIKNSDQATVQLLRVSGALDKLRTTAGDALLQGLQPGLKSIADALDGDGLANGLETLGTLFGGALTVGIRTITPLLNDFSKAIGNFAETLKRIFPGLAKVLEDPSLAGAKSSAKAERQIFGDFTKLGQDTPLEDFDKIVKSEPNEKLASIRRIQDKVNSFQSPELTDKFIPALAEQEVAALKEVLAKQLATVDTSNFPGRRLAAQLSQTNAADQIAAANKGLAVAQDSYEKAKASGNIDEQSRQSAIINQFNQEIAEAGKAASLAAKEIQNSALDERKAIQTVRNATEGLADAEKDQALKLKDLTRSLQEATDAVTTFASKVEAAFASKEEQVLQAAKAVEDAGGPSLIGNIDERLADAKLRSASTKFNELSAEVGLGITAPEAPGARLSRIGTPFSNSIDNQGAKLEDNVQAINNEIDRLPRVIRDLTEAFDDLIARTKQLFNSNTIPTNQPGIPTINYTGGSSSGGALSPGIGGAAGGGIPTMGSTSPGNPLDFLPDPRDGGIGSSSGNPLDFLPDPRDGGMGGFPESMFKALTPKMDYSKGPLQGGVGAASSLLERQRAARESNYENISSIEELYALQDTDGLTEEDKAELTKSLEGTGLKISDVIGSANIEGVIAKAKANGNSVQKGNIDDDPNVFYRPQDPYLKARDRASKVMRLIDPLYPDPNSESGEEEKKETLGRIVSPILDNPINSSAAIAGTKDVLRRQPGDLLNDKVLAAQGGASAKDKAIFEDLTGGFLDADVDGLKKQNRAPASGLKNPLFSGGLFGDREDVKSGKGTAESNFADSVGAKIDENFNKLGDIISKALGGAL